MKAALVLIVVVYFALLIWAVGLINAIAVIVVAAWLTLAVNLLINRLNKRKD